MFYREQNSKARQSQWQHNRELEIYMIDVRICDTLGACHMWKKNFGKRGGRPLSAPWVEVHMGEYILQGGSDPGWHRAISKQCIGRYFSSIRNPYNQKRCINYWSFKRMLKTSKIFGFYSLADYWTPVLRRVLEITVCPSVFLSFRQCVFSFLWFFAWW